MIGPPKETPAGQRANHEHDQLFEPTPTFAARKGATASLLVSIMRDKFARGWPRHEEGERVYTLPLSQALTRSYSSDAHFPAYASPNGRRLTREALDQLEGIALTAFVVDIDCLAVHGSSEPAPEPWRTELRGKVDALAAVHPAPFVYFTRGGARVVFAQAEPTILRSQEDARRWSRSYAIGIAYLARRFDIIADPACADWQRLYRLPHATREPGGKPESWATIGDPTCIGALTIDATHEDVEAARRSSKAFHESRVVDFEPCSGDGHGLLFHALQARGDVKRQHGRNAYVIRCPNECEHTTGTSGDGSTVLFLPARGEHVGAIHCMHGHCSSMRVRDWVRCFDRNELEAAERAAGIARRVA